MRRVLELPREEIFVSCHRQVLDFDIEILAGMLVLCIMYSKRQRRPNVRLGEVGDVPAAFACSFNPSPTRKRWRRPMALKESEINHTSGFSNEKSSEATESDFGPSPRVSADSDNNRENKNPNSSNRGFEFVNLDGGAEAIPTKPDFSNVTRKCRVMKRRGRRKMNDCNFLNGDWSHKLPESILGEGHAFEEKEFAQFTTDTCNLPTNNEFKAVSDHETPATSKEACDYDLYEPSYDQWQQANFSASKEDASSEEHCALPEAAGLGRSDVNNVSKWLEEIGFGRYAVLFELHEVDEEVLPLLTPEDLKEIGMLAVGPRRKLYTAIQKKRVDVSSQ